MSKVTKYSNYRVTVLPAEPWIFKGNTPQEIHQAWLREANTLLEQIKRHVDSEWAGVEFDRTEVCEFCEEPYEGSIDLETGEPACCSAAQSEWVEASEALSSQNSSKLADDTAAKPGDTN
jgi:hypothetical protein